MKDKYRYFITASYQMQFTKSLMPL